MDEVPYPSAQVLLMRKLLFVNVLVYNGVSA